MNQIATQRGHSRQGASEVDNRIPMFHADGSFAALKDVSKISSRGTMTRLTPAAVQCSACGGTGKAYRDEVCRSCDGKGVVWKQIAEVLFTTEGLERGPMKTQTNSPIITSVGPRFRTRKDLIAEATRLSGENIIIKNLLFELNRRGELSPAQWETLERVAASYHLVEGVTGHAALDGLNSRYQGKKGERISRPATVILISKHVYNGVRKVTLVDDNGNLFISATERDPPPPKLTRWQMDGIVFDHKLFKNYENTQLTSLKLSPVQTSEVKETTK